MYSHVTFVASRFQALFHQLFLHHPSIRMYRSQENTKNASCDIEGCPRMVEVDVFFVDGKIAADRAAMLIVNVKRINSKIPIVVLAEDESNKTRVLEYGADDFATKPVSADT